jgi:small nuclear ribonucleoprotein (snRNP)-like protein
MLVELKNGETLNGHLVNCDTWMNLTLKEVVQTSPEGDKFFRLAEVYVRGNNVSAICSIICRVNGLAAVVLLTRKKRLNISGYRKRSLI